MVFVCSNRPQPDPLQGWWFNRFCVSPSASACGTGMGHYTAFVPHCWQYVHTAIAPDTWALRERVTPHMGISTHWSHRGRSDTGTPACSLPSSRTVAGGKVKACRGTDPVACSTAAGGTGRGRGELEAVQVGGACMNTGASPGVEIQDSRGHVLVRPAPASRKSGHPGLPTGVSHTLSLTHTRVHAPPSTFAPCTTPYGRMHACAPPLPSPLLTHTHPFTHPPPCTPPPSAPSGTPPRPSPPPPAAAATARWSQTAGRERRRGGSRAQGVRRAVRRRE